MSLRGRGPNWAQRRPSFISAEYVTAPETETQQPCNNDNANRLY